MFDYIRDPENIYDRSFAIIRNETDLSVFPHDIEPIIVRLIHACGMTDIIKDLEWSSDVAIAARDALLDGAPIFVDAHMVAHGIIRERLPCNNLVICAVSEPDVRDFAESVGTTRSAAAVETWREQLSGAVVAIGNAPTALFRLLELLADGAQKPAAIFGFPVGFVGAMESKDALIKYADGIPFITLRGRKGGSAMAAAAINSVTGDLA